MKAFTTRLLAVAVVLVALSVLGVLGWRAALDRYAGAWTHAPEDARWILDDAAQALFDSAFAGVKGAVVVDEYVDVPARAQYLDAPSAEHRLALEQAEKSISPLAWLSNQLRDHAAGILDHDRPAAAYLSRLLRQIQAMPIEYRARLVARDALYASDGRRDDAATFAPVANENVARLAAQAPGQLSSVVSIHPYRVDALDEITRWAEAGAVAVRWDPVAQAIDLNDPRVAAFYTAMSQQGLALYLPVGQQQGDDEKPGWVGVDALSAPLAAGLDVLISIADPVSAEGQSLMPALFALLRDSQHAAGLQISLAGVLARERLETVLEPLLQHPEFFGHLRYASGYPQPAIASAISLEALAAGGFIDRSTIRPLREIYDVNPLLFMLVALREIRLPATDLGLPETVFFQTDI